VFIYITDLYIEHAKMIYCSMDRMTRTSSNTREIFQICREKGFILSAKKLVIGMSSVPFVGHEVASVGLNMT